MPRVANEAREIAGYVALILALSMLCAAAGAGLAILIEALTNK